MFCSFVFSDEVCRPTVDAAAAASPNAFFLDLVQRVHRIMDIIEVCEHCLAECYAQVAGMSAQ